MIKLRPYQSDAVKESLDFLNREYKTKLGIISLPTGSGKSFVIADSCYKLNSKVLILQPNKEILEQNYAKLKMYGIEDIGIYSASLKEKTIGKFTYATIGSIIKHPDLIQQFDNIIIDECHNVNFLDKDSQYMKLIGIVNKPIIGLTATPYRLRTLSNMTEGKNGRIIYDNKSYTNFMTNVQGLESELIYNVNPKDIADDWWAKCNIIDEKSVEFDKIKLNSTGTDWNEKELKRYMEESDINFKTIQTIKESNEKSNKILVFCRFLEQCDSLKMSLDLIGIKSEIISSKLKKKERENIIKEFKSGNIDVVLNVGVLTVGFDMPELDCIIMARPTMSVSLFYQMFGRVVRPHEDKVSTVYDLVGNFERFGNPLDYYIKKDYIGKYQLYNNTEQITGKELSSFL